MILLSLEPSTHPASALAPTVPLRSVGPTSSTNALVGISITSTTAFGLLNARQCSSMRSTSSHALRRFAKAAGYTRVSQNRTASYGDDRCKFNLSCWMGGCLRIVVCLSFPSLEKVLEGLEIARQKGSFLGGDPRQLFS